MAHGGQHLSGYGHILPHQYTPALQTLAVAQERINMQEDSVTQGQISFLCVSAVAQEIDVTGHRSSEGTCLGSCAP